MLPVPNQQNQVSYVAQQDYVANSVDAGSERHARTFYKLGWIQIVLSVLSLIFGITILAYAVEFQYNPYEDYRYYYYDGFAYIGTGIWSSAFIFTSGILGVLQTKKKTRCLLNAALTMTIFSALAGAALFALEVAGATDASYRVYDGYYLSRANWKVSLGIHAALSCIGFAAMVTSIIHSAYCCNAHTCCTSDKTAAPGRITYAYVNPSQVTSLPGPPAPLIQNPQVTPVGFNSGQVLQQPYIITTAQPQPIGNYQQVPMQMNLAYLPPQQTIPQSSTIASSSPSQPPEYQQSSLKM